MAALWDFLTDEANRDVIAWLLGGLMVAVSGVWTALRGKKPATAGAPASGVPPMAWVLGALGLGVIVVAILFSGDRTTVTNGIVTHGDVTDSTQTVGQ